MPGTGYARKGTHGSLSKAGKVASLSKRTFRSGFRHDKRGGKIAVKYKHKKKREGPRMRNRHKHRCRIVLKRGTKNLGERKPELPRGLPQR